MLAVTVTSHDQCLAIVRWLAAAGCHRRYRYLPSPAAAAASRHCYHRYSICAGNSFTPSVLVTDGKPRADRKFRKAKKSEPVENH
jgi:hypothetical protein